MLRQLTIGARKSTAHRRGVRAGAATAATVIVLGVSAIAYASADSDSEDAVVVQAKGEVPADQSSASDDPPLRDFTGVPVPPGYQGVVDTSGTPRGFVSYAEQRAALDNGPATIMLGGGAG